MGSLCKEALLIGDRLWWTTVLPPDHPQWLYSFAQGPEQARALLQTRTPGVAVIDFTRFGNRLPEIFELITHYDNLAWVGVVKKGTQQQPELRSILANNLFDFHFLPLHGEHFLFTLDHAFGVAALRHESDDNPSLSEQWLGRSRAMQQMVKPLAKAANSELTVLIQGESGTGKERLARLLHEQSPRANKPFLALNCGALPAQLIQSELFGHEKGAFTGAIRSQRGLLEMADGGTLLLDEIGDFPLELQVNLLRFLQEQSFIRVGGRAEVKVDTRIIAATHVNLKQAVAEKTFREDLYYRLNVMRFCLPPLRERREDLEPLAHHFLQAFDSRHRLQGFDRQALMAMQRYAWPGNIRELENRIQRAVILCERRWITPEDLDLPTFETPPVVSLKHRREQIEKQVLHEALHQGHANMAELAQSLDVSRATLYRLLDKHQLS